MAYNTYAKGEEIRCADGSLYYCPNWMGPLSKFNIANCAAQRARAAAGDGALYDAEYETCRSWTLRSFAVHV